MNATALDDSTFTVTTDELRVLRLYLESWTPEDRPVSDLPSATELRAADPVLAFDLLCSRGYAVSVAPGRYQIDPRLLAIAAVMSWPSTILRIRDYRAGVAQGLVFAYGVVGLAITDVVGADGTHVLLGRPPADVAAAVRATLLSAAIAEDPEYGGVVSLGLLGAIGSRSPVDRIDAFARGGIARDRAAILASTLAAGNAIRLDTASRRGATPSETRMTLFTGGVSDGAWMATNQGHDAASLVTIRAATPGDVGAALSEMYRMTVFS